MRVICTTVVRSPKQGAPYGYIYDIDWDALEIRKTLPIFAPKDALGLLRNPFTRFRGPAGLRLTCDAVYVAMGDRITKYDYSWNEVGQIVNPWFSELHELVVDEDGVWAASTGLDLAIKVDFSGKVIRCWSPRTYGPLKVIYGIQDQYRGRWPSGYGMGSFLAGAVLRRFGRLGSLPTRSGAPYHVLNVKPKTVVESWLWRIYRRFPALSADDFHLNSVYRFQDELYVTIFKWPWNEKACVIRIEPDLGIELGCPGLSMVHNGQIIDEERLIINDTGNQSVKLFERKTNRLIRDFPSTSIGIQGPVWLRGLKKLSDERVLVGVGANNSYGPVQTSRPPPTQIVELELSTGRVLKRLILTEDTTSSVHGLDAIEE